MSPGSVLVASPSGVVAGAVAYHLARAGFDAHPWDGREVVDEIGVLVADEALPDGLALPRSQATVRLHRSRARVPGSAALAADATPDDLVELVGALLGSVPAAVPACPPQAVDTRVVYAAAPPSLALAVAGWLGHQDGVEVVAVAHDGERALAAVDRFRPDVVVLDRTIAGPDALESCARLRAAGSSTFALVIDERASPMAMLDAVEAGAHGFWHGQALEPFLAAVRRLGRGEASIPPELLGVLLRDLIDRRRSDDAVLHRWLSLSRRERDVVRHLARGCGSREVATILFVSANTARTHIQNVLRKLQVHSQAEAVALALDHDLFTRFDEEPGEDGADDRH